MCKFGLQSREANLKTYVTIKMQGSLRYKRVDLNSVGSDDGPKHLFNEKYVSHFPLPSTLLSGSLPKQPRLKYPPHTRYTRGYQKVLSLTWKEPEIWIYSALFFNVVPFQLHTLVPSSFPVINTRSVEVNILVP